MLRVLRIETDSFEHHDESMMTLIPNGLNFSCRSNNICRISKRDKISFRLRQYQPKVGTSIDFAYRDLDPFFTV